jgi:hypothetical protein
MREMDAYERRVKSRVGNLEDRRDELNEKIFRKQLDIILNNDPSKLGLFEKVIDEMENELDNLEPHINALEKNRD